MGSLRELFEETLRDVYYAEKAILKALPKMAKKASSEKLTTAFQDHMAQTEAHVGRLEDVFEMIGRPARAKRCAAMDGIIEEASEIMSEMDDDTVRDAGMLAAAQAVEHYEISRYGTLSAWAEKLGMDDAVELLNTTLQEEKDTDSLLTKLAESEINVEADEGDHDGGEASRQQKRPPAKRKAKAG